MGVFVDSSCSNKLKRIIRRKSFLLTSVPSPRDMMVTKPGWSASQKSCETYQWRWPLLSFPHRLVPAACCITVVLSTLEGAVGKASLNCFMGTSADYWHFRKQSQGKTVKNGVLPIGGSLKNRHSWARQGDTTQYRSDVTWLFSAVPSVDPLACPVT